MTHRLWKRCSYFAKTICYPIPAGYAERCAKLRSIWETISCCELLQFSKLLHFYWNTDMVVWDERTTFQCEKNCGRSGVLTFMYLLVGIFSSIISFSIANIDGLYSHSINHREKKRHWKSQLNPITTLGDILSQPLKSMSRENDFYGFNDSYKTIFFSKKWKILCVPST